MTNKQFLRQAYRLDDLIKSNQREIESLKILMVGVKSPSLSHNSNACSKTDKNASFTRIIEKISVLETNIIEETEKFLEIKIQIRKSIDNMKNVDEKLVLKLKYLEFMTFEEVAESLNYSISQIHRIHKNALHNFKIYKK